MKRSRRRPRRRKNKKHPPGTACSRPKSKRARSSKTTKTKKTTKKVKKLQTDPVKVSTTRLAQARAKANASVAASRNNVSKGSAIDSMLRRAESDVIIDEIVDSSDDDIEAQCHLRKPGARCRSLWWKYHLLIDCVRPREEMGGSM